MNLTDICNNKNSVKFLKRASQFDVKFIVIGGSAMCFYGGREPGSIKDLDIYIEPEIGNIEKLLHVFQFFNINLVSDPARLCQPDMKLNILNEDLHIDILSPKHGEEFDDLYNNSTEIDSLYPGIRILGKDDMIRVKERTIDDISKRLDVHNNDLTTLRRQLSES